MRNIVVLTLVLLMPACASMTYTSKQPAETVANCIANGWRKVPDSGYEIPVSLTRTESYYFVDVVLVRDFPTGTPLHSIWAKVSPGAPGTASGSTTEYQRNFQIKHQKIDRVVKDCQ